MEQTSNGNKCYFCAVYNLNSFYLNINALEMHLRFGIKLILRLLLSQFIGPNKMLCFRAMISCLISMLVVSRFKQEFSFANKLHETGEALFDS